MSERVTMPALGESVTEGTVTRWLKQVGDQVAVDEPLLEVSTDKVDTEIPSPVAGTLQEILVGEDATVPVGADLAVIGDGAPSESSGADSGGADSDAESDSAQAAPAAEAAPRRRPPRGSAAEAAPSYDDASHRAEPEPQPEPEPAAEAEPAAPAPAEPAAQERRRRAGAGPVAVATPVRR